MHLELEYEYNLTVMNPWIESIYKYCCENGKQIIIITDIYLPEKFIKRVLKRLGLIAGDIYLFPAQVVKLKMMEAYMI